MAKPNLVNATSIYAKSMVHTGTGTSITVLSCPSNKAYRITSFAVTGTAGTTTDREKWEAKLNRAGIATAEPTAANRVEEDGAIECITNGGSTNASKMEITFVIRR